MSLNALKCNHLTPLGLKGLNDYIVRRISVFADYMPYLMNYHFSPIPYRLPSVSISGALYYHASPNAENTAMRLVYMVTAC